MEWYVLVAILALGACSSAQDFVPTLRDNGTADGSEVWGYVDIRPDAHTFWWLYKTYHADGYLNRPWIIWLQGGPGSSSTGYGNFELIGPLDLNLNPRNWTWVGAASVLFIDNPVGTGYSYVDNSAAYTTTNAEIAADLVTMIKSFLASYPEFQTIPLYIFGESYGGKMGTEFGRELQREIDLGTVTCNLQGVANGNAWLSAEDICLEWAPLLYTMGNLDENGYTDVKDQSLLISQSILNGQWNLATQQWKLLENKVWQWTYYVDFYNILKYVTPGSRDAPTGAKAFPLDPTTYNINLAPFAQDPLTDLMNGPIRDKLGIIPSNVVFGSQGGAVFNVLEGDFMKPVLDVMDDILNNTNLNLVIYEGQLDLICLNMGAMRYVQKLKWPGLANFNAAERFWTTDPDTAQTDLYYKVNQGFKYYWVNNAGHMVPKDYPSNAYRLLERIILNVDV